MTGKSYEVCEFLRERNGQIKLLDIIVVFRDLNKTELRKGIELWINEKKQPLN